MHSFEMPIVSIESEIFEDTSQKLYTIFFVYAECKLPEGQFLPNCLLPYYQYLEKYLVTIDVFLINELMLKIYTR